MSRLKSPTYYEILGLSPGASIEEIEAAGRRALFRWHPDRNADDRAGAGRAFLDVQEALAALKDPVARATYDVRMGWVVPSNVGPSTGVRFEQTTAEASRVLAERRQRAATRSDTEELGREMEALAALARGRAVVSRGRFYGFAGLVLLAAAFHLLTVTTVFDGFPVIASATSLGVASLLFLSVARDALGQRLRRHQYRERAAAMVASRRRVRAPFGPPPRR